MIHCRVKEMPWKGLVALYRTFELETGDVVDERLINLIAECNSYDLILPCDYFYVDTLLRSK